MNLNENQSFNLTQNKKGTAAVIILVIVAVLAIGAAGGVTWFWWQNQKKIEDYQNQTKDLQNQLTEAKKKVEELEQEKLTSEDSEEKTTIDETADWKTYTNSSLGISFKYPSNYILKDQLAGDEKAVLLGDKEFPKPDIAPWYHSPVSIGPTDNEKNNNNINSLSNKITSSIKVGNENASVTEGKYADYPNNPPKYNMKIIVIRSKNLTITIQESYANTTSSWDGLTSVMSKILKTFKFTK